jgi:hypothetical protein
MTRGTDQELLTVAKAFVRQVEGRGHEIWRDSEWEAALADMLRLVARERSPLLLGDFLRLDIGLDLPFEVVTAAYKQLFKLGVNDCRSRLCYARYLKLHGPEWDHQADLILEEVEQAARLAGEWDSPYLGHHPVFYADRHDRFGVQRPRQD